MPDMPTDSDSPVELRALVVDDNVDAATSLSYILQLLGCKTAVAFGGAMGLRVAQLFQPAVVFLDIGMPGQDGFEVLAEARRVGAMAGAYLVCLTGRSDPSDERACLDAGFDRFVKKPMEADVLHDVLVEARKRVNENRATGSSTSGGVPGP
jgi:CheY-like chemotaxis protein